jgi:alpha-tubulin suppressor-like RCC1 family protein
LGWPVLGLGVTNRSTSLRRVGDATNWVSISAGTSHNLAIKSDGTLWTWGRVLPYVRTPIAVPAPVAPGHDWKQAAAGDSYSVAVKTDGTLWGWGGNWSGWLGPARTNGSTVPIRIGSDTNWTKVWAGRAASVAMQDDGSLWCWGGFPSPDDHTQAATISTPRRISPDTNWVDAGFLGRTVFAIKWDGTLWAWGHDAERFTEATDPAQDAVPTRVGTNSDWKAISTHTWNPFWPGSAGLIQKDGSLWLMAATASKINGPTNPFPPARLQRTAFQGESVAYAGGAMGVALTAKGEVWSWGSVLGKPPSFRDRALTVVAELVNHLPIQKKIAPPYPRPAFAFRKEPWQLRNE